MLGRIYIVIMFLSNPGAGSVAEGSRRDGPSPLSRWCCCSCYLVLILLSCSYRCYLVSFVGLLVLIAVNLYARIIMAPIQFCHPSYLKRAHFCTLVFASQLRVMIHHPPTRFYSPPPLNISKYVIFIPKLPICRDFCRFFARKNVKYKPI